MTTSKKRDLIEGRAALIVIDIQKSTFAPIPDDKRAIAHMPDYAERMARSKVAIDKAREVGIDLSTLGLSRPVAIRDLWEGKGLGTQAQRIVAHLPPHGAALYRLS